MTFTMLGRALELFPRYRLKILRLQAASRYRPIDFDSEGSSLDRCLPVSGLANRSQLQSLAPTMQQDFSQL
jgi:hypothetical protein